MHFILNNSTDPYFNMAFDQAVLERGPAELVFYLWRNSPAVIIGRNQNAFAEVNLPYLEANGIALVRRITGGGAVYHDLGNLNYSIVGPTRCFADEKPTVIADALRSMGIPAELGGRNDIFVDGRKCSGYARRLWKDRTMIHGTLMFNVNLECLVQALSVPGSKISASGVASVHSKVANLCEYFNGTMEQFTASLQEYLRSLDSARDDNDCHFDQAKRAEKSFPVDDSRFRSWEWNYGKSPEAAFSKTRKFPCGTVTASYSLVHGCLHNVRFTGDFIGSVDISALEQRLEGAPLCHFEPAEKSLLNLLEDTPDFFDGLSPIDLYNFLI